MSNIIKTSSTYRMQDITGQFILGQFILETVSNFGAVKVSKFVAEINHEMVYMDIEINKSKITETVFAGEGFFYSFLDANINNEVFNKAEFECVNVTVTEQRWTLTLG